MRDEAKTAATKPDMQVPAMCFKRQF